MKNKGRNKPAAPKPPSAPRPASKPTAPSPAAPPKAQGSPPKTPPTPPKPPASPPKTPPTPPKAPASSPKAAPATPKPQTAPKTPPAAAARPASTPKPEIAILDSDALASVPAAPPPPASPFAPIPPPAAALPKPEVADGSKPNARSHKRLGFEVELTIVSDHNFYAGLTLNISEGGLFVGTHVDYPVGTLLEIRLHFPGDEEPTSVMTEVRWVRSLHAAGNSTPGMGLRFVDLTPALADKIGRFARQREPLYYEDD